MPVVRASVAVVIVVVVAVLFAASTANAPSSGKKVLSFFEPSDEERAGNAAWTMVLKGLKSPDDAALTSSRILEKQHPYYLVFAEAELAGRRKQFLVSVKLGKGDEFFYNKLFAVHQFDDPDSDSLPTGFELEVFKKANGWPD